MLILSYFFPAIIGTYIILPSTCAINHVRYVKVHATNYMASSHYANHCTSHGSQPGTLFSFFSPSRT